MWHILPLRLLGGKNVAYTASQAPRREECGTNSPPRLLREKGGNVAETASQTPKRRRDMWHKQPPRHLRERRICGTNSLPGT